MSEMVKQFLAAMVAFYASYSGEPFYKVIERNFDQPIVIAYPVHPEHSSFPEGDLDGNLIVGDGDVAAYNDVSGNPVGWTVGGKARKHLFRRCFYIAEKPATLAEIHNDVCLRCMNQWAKEALSN